MNTPCPHCRVNIEIDPPTLAALAGHSHFNCPACQGAVAVPSRPLKLASAQRGISRNLLILGSVALLALGGIGFYLASQKSGDATTVNQNIRNEIINNTYFQNLIATGITTKQDLEAIESIRPYQNGFIGISAAKLGWQEASIMATRTGGVVLDAGSDAELSSWLVKTFATSSTSLAWILTRGDAGLLTSAGAVALKNADGEHKVLLHWRSSEKVKADLERTAIATKANSDASGILTDGLIAYYPFNGNAEDASGNGFHAEVHGAVLTKDKAGNADSAYQFDGKSSFILAPVNINPDIMPNLTMIAWARNETNQPYGKLISHDAGGFGRTIGIDNRGGGPGWSAFCGSGAVLGYEPPRLRKWDFVAVVYEEKKEMITLFVNDRKMMKQGITKKGMKNLTIGNNPFSDKFFHGVIDEVRIYNRALGEAEIQQFYQNFSAQSDPEEDKLPVPYIGRNLSVVVDLESAAVWENDEFKDPTRSGFVWAVKDQFKDGRITLDGIGKPCWGTSAHKFNDFAVQVLARTSRDKHSGWGVCIYKHPEGKDAQGVEVLLDSEGMLSIIDCRWTPPGQKDIAPVGPIPVTSFRKGEFNTLVAAFSEGRKLAVFVNGAEACAPIELPYILEPASLQLASAGGASVPSRLEFESFKVFSLDEKNSRQIPVEGAKPEQSATEPTVDVWIDTQGRKIHAVFLRFEGENLVINLKDKETRIPLSRLSPESIALAQKRLSESKP